MDKHLVAIRENIVIQRNKYKLIIIFAALASIAFTSVGVFMLETIGREDPAQEIVELKLTVLNLVPAAIETTESTIRADFRCAEQKDIPNCNQARQKALSERSIAYAKYQTAYTQLQWRGVTFDVASREFHEDYKDGVPLYELGQAEFQRKTETIRIFVAPILLLIFTGLNTFFVRQYMRYDTLYFVLSTYETDRAFHEAMTKTGKIMEHFG